MRNRQIEQNNGCQHKRHTTQPSNVQRFTKEQHTDQRSDNRLHASHDGSLARVHPGQSLGVQQIGQDSAQHTAA